MQINYLEVANIRNFEKASIHPSPNINFIVGNNGSGKTSLLESISLITSTRSFRTSKTSIIQKKGEKSFFLFAKIVSEDIEHIVGYQKSVNERKIKLNQRYLSRSSELAKLFPVISFTPESLTLLTEGSKERRSFIDRTMFHVKHDYLFHQHSYKRCLVQRNTLLSQNNPKLLDQWDMQISIHGEWIAEKRAEVLTSLQSIVEQVINKLEIESFAKLTLSINRGWDKKLSLEEALKDSQQKDIKAGFTTVGTHRADIQIKQDGRLIKEIFSRGELKLLSFVLYLSQMIYLNKNIKTGTILLIDDLFAEVDKKNIDKLFKTIRHYNTQTFITTTDQSIINQYQQNEDKVFHVKHGTLKEVL